VSTESSVIAARDVRVDDQDSVVTIALRAPSPDPEGDWECTYTIDGLDIPHVGSAKGIDSVQALTMALEGIRVVLERSGKSFSWEGGDGDAGFPRFVPMAFGSEFSAALNRTIDQEVVKHSEWLEQRYKQSSGRRATP
jgi:hypothetical protein